MTADYNPVDVERLVRALRLKATTALNRTRFQDDLAEAADQLEAASEIVNGLSPQKIQDLVDENDRLMKAFDEALTKLRNGGSVHAGFCCWCGQHWPHLDGDSFETLRKYTVDHAEACPGHSIRIERDALRRKLGQIAKYADDLDANGGPEDGGSYAYLAVAKALRGILEDKP